MKYALMAFLVVFACLLFGANTVLEINVEGNNNIESNLIKSALAFEVGDELNMDHVSKSIKSLYRLGVFDNISVEESTLPQGLSITILVSEYSIIKEMSYEGNNKISDSSLDELISIRKGSYFSPFLEAETKKKIKDKYKEKGYYSAQVEYVPSTEKNGKIELTIVINEGKKVRVREIRIDGNNVYTATKLRRKMKTKESSFFRSGKFDKIKFKEDLKQLLAFYNSEGFIDARIISHEVKQTNETSLEIDIAIYEGEQFHFGTVSVEGNKKYTDERIASEFKFKDKEIFDMAKFEQQLAKVAALYYDEGYIYSRFDHELIKNGDTVDINLILSENTRAKVRKIHLTGNRKCKEKVVRRQLRIHPGDYFRQSLAMESQKSIYNTGFFEPDISLDYQPINSNGDIDVTIKMNDKLSGSANGGVGYNSQDKVVGQLSLSHNNLFGNSWATSLKSEFGGTTQNFEFDFSNPYFYDSSTAAGVALSHTQKKWSSFNYKVYTNGGGIRAGFPISFLNYGSAFFGYNLYSKKYDILERSDYASVALTELDSLGWRYTSSLSMTLSRDSRDNFYFPLNGSKVILYSELAGGPFQGDFDYFKQIGQVNWYSKLFWKVALRTKWRAGFVEAYGDSKSVPPDERFYLGGTGANGIRGFGDRTVGPEDGGLRMMLFSSELAVPMGGDQIIGLVFFDAGNSFNSYEEFNFWGFKRGAGLGIRVRSPFGVIGFDYANNLNENKWEPHFQFGTNF